MPLWVHMMTGKPVTIRGSQSDHVVWTAVVPNQLGLGNATGVSGTGFLRRANFTATLAINLHVHSRKVLEDGLTALADDFLA